MKKNPIGWTDVTWNPTDGCEVCSPGCANCYAMRFAGRFAKPGERYHGLVSIAKNKRAVWTGQSRLDAGKLAKPLFWRKPRMVFVNSMSDLFYEGFTNEQIVAVFGVMAACPQHQFQVLTKRARRMREWFEWLDRSVDQEAAEWSGRECVVDIHDARRECLVDTLEEAGCEALSGRVCHLGLTTGTPIRWPLPNVWLGVSTENQAAADERIPDLLATPAAVRFISAEPLLGPIDLTRWTNPTCPHCGDRNEPPRRDSTCENCGEVWSPHLQWIISGCESGPGARPADVAWLRSLRDQCAEAGVPYFLKQAVRSFEATGHRAVEPSKQARRLVVANGPGSKRKAGGVIHAPYLDGRQHLELPVRGESDSW